MPDKKDEIAILNRALKRERAARKAAESILEQRSTELYELSTQLEQSNQLLQDAVFEKTSRLSGIFENISDAYCVIDLNGKVLELNDTARRLFHLFEGDTSDFNALSMLLPEDLDHAFNSFESLLQNGHINDFIVQIRNRNNDMRWVQINATIVTDHANKPIGAQGILRDITQIKNTTRLIQQQRDELEFIVENSPFGVVLSKDGEIVRANARFASMLGYNIDTVIGKTIRDLTYPNDRELSVPYSKKLTDGSIDQFQIEKRYVKQDGSLLWARTRVRVVRDPNGNINYHTAIVEDIIDEKERHLTLDVINNVARAVLGKEDPHEIAWEIVNEIARFLNAEDCVIYLLNTDGNAMDQIAAYGDKAIGHSVLDKISIPLGKGIVGTVGATGIAEVIGDTTKDTRYIVDDDVRHSEITVPIKLNDEVIGVIDSEHHEKGFFRDHHLQTLTNIANLVAMQLYNAVMKDQRDTAMNENLRLFRELELNNEELKEYAHVVSHDLKSPLRNINALVNWIKEDAQESLDDSTKGHLDMIEETLEHMEQLIEGVLHFSSIDNEERVYDWIDLNDLVSEIVAMSFVPEHIEIVTSNTLPRMRMYKTHIQQLFQNLISNAIKYNDKPKGRIEIGCSDRDSHYEFFVKDNGKGIDPVYFEKIFKMFQSLEQGKDSTGVGLSIVKKIAELYQGKVWVESEPNEGSTFYFTLKK